MDGSTVAPIPDRGLSRPFLFLGKQSNYTPGSGGAVTPGTRDWKIKKPAPGGRLLRLRCAAVSYSPARPPSQYHRR